MKAFDGSLEAALTDWARELRFEDLPDSAIAQSKRLLLDTLACAWAGAGAEGVAAVRDFIVQQGGKAESRLWGSGDHVPAPAAALLNGLFAAALDLDSVHDEATMHPDIIMVPALMALADIVPVSGRDFIIAHVAGDELMVRLGLAAGPHRGWFLTSALGVFVCAAICARVLQLSTAQMRSAMGIVLSRAAGSQQTLLEGSFTKRLQSAYAARDGVEAALLARIGVTGPSQALTGSAGYASLYTSLDSGIALHRLGSDYKFLSLTLKQYASCFCNHASIVAALDLIRLHDVQAEDIEAGKVTLPPMSYRLVGGLFEPHRNPQVAAQFSAQYSVANVFHRRRFSVDDISPNAVLDPDVLALSSRFEVTCDDSLTGKFVPATVSLRLRNGRELQRTATSIPGTPSDPLTEAQIKEKALSCLVRGPQALRQDDAAALVERLSNLEKLDDVRTLWKA